MDYRVIGIIAGTFSVIVFLPQIIKMAINRSAKDVSTGMFAVASTGNGLWAYYGYLIHDYAVMITSLSVSILALIGIIIALSFKRK
jgi:uncharacterized protein with PQ loop repeat